MEKVKNSIYAKERKASYHKAVAADEEKQVKVARNSFEVRETRPGKRVGSAELR